MSSTAFRHLQVVARFVACNIQVSPRQSMRLRPFRTKRSLEHVCTRGGTATCASEAEGAVHARCGGVVK
eukprot:2494722-Pleurochrysis_carterae.AAC.1